MKNNSDFLTVATPAPWDRGAPVINGPVLWGATPGRELLYALPVRGERPLHFEWSGEIPPGLRLDPDRGFVTGRAPAGIYRLRFLVSNRLGRAEKPFRFEIAPNRLCRTPLLGWSSWNACVDLVTQEAVAEAATLMAATGLQARGYSYINIDSCWQGTRGGESNAIQPNAKFPDMKALVDHIHRLGLHAGIYSTPMVQAWGAINHLFLPGSTGYPLDPAYYHFYFGGCGKTPFETNDAAAFAKWGFDYLKYDWPECDIMHTERMRRALDATGRDFVLSLCTSCDWKLYDDYSRSANILRANGDTRARWNVILRNGFTGDHWSKLVRPGCWFDMDMLGLGVMQMNVPSEENREGATDGLSRDEAITHFLAWACFPCSLQLSCDLAKLDGFTGALVANEEVLAVNQDEFAGCSECIEETRTERNGKLERRVKLYRRPLANGDVLFTAFNLGEVAEKIACPLPSGDFARFRDLLAGENLDSPDFALPPHGARAVRMIRRENLADA